MAKYVLRKPKTKAEYDWDSMEYVAPTSITVIETEIETFTGLFGPNGEEIHVIPNKIGFIDFEDE